MFLTPSNLTTKRFRNKTGGGCMKKCLKMTVVFSLVLVLPLLTIGCGNGQAKNEKPASSNTPAAIRAEVADVTSQNATSASKEEAKSASSQEEAKSASSEKEAKSVEPEADDPYALYRVSEEWIKEMGGMVIERNGALYSLSGHVPQSVLDDYGVGLASVRRGLEDRAFLFMFDQVKITDVPTASTKTLVTAGDFPLIKVNRNERVRLYSTTTVTHLGIVPTKQIGYTIEAIAHSDIGMYSPVLNKVMTTSQIVGTHPSVCDMTDTPVADVHDLEYGQKYKYIWYEGTEYHEMTLTADCKCYDWPTNNPLDSRVINLPVILGKDGYATVDFSGAEPGIYCAVPGGALFEVE